MSHLGADQKPPVKNMRLTDNIARYLWRLDGQRTPNHQPFLAAALDHAADVEAAMNDVESLGGSFVGCEIGSVQRLFGAEPLGLLRWSEMTEKYLLAAMRARFAGVGLPENTEVFIKPDKHHPEYRTRDTRFFMEMHSFVKADAMPLEAFTATACKRLVYLRDKLLDDLSAGAKLFVFKMSSRTLTDETLEDLRSAMSNFGSNTLMYVRLADAEHPAGTVEERKPGLLIGYIDRFASGPNGEDLGANPDGWLPILRRGAAIWREQSARQATA